MLIQDDFAFVLSHCDEKKIEMKKITATLLIELSEDVKEKTVARTVIANYPIKM